MILVGQLISINVTFYNNTKKHVRMHLKMAHQGSPINVAPAIKPTST